MKFVVHFMNEGYYRYVKSLIIQPAVQVCEYHVNTKK